MLQFLKSRKFKAFLLVICALFIGAVFAVASDNSSSPVTNIIGTVFSPVQKLSSYLSEKVNWFNDSFASADVYKNEVERLEEQVAEYENQLVDYDEIKNKMNSYESMLGVKEDNPDFELANADIIGTDAADMFSSLIIDKGSNSNISVNDPVISGNYVVGIVRKVHPSYSVVETIYNPELNISAIESKTRETAYVTTTVEYSEKEACLFSGLDKTTAVSPGGIVITSGIGGLYPKGLIIGTVVEVNESDYDISSYAVLNPGVSIKDLENVFVITNFEGQGIEEVIDEN